VINYLVNTFMLPTNEEMDLNLSPTRLAELEAFKTVAMTVAKHRGRSKPLADRYYLMTLGVLTRYTFLIESKGSSFFSSSSSSSAWHPLPSLTEYLEALGSMGKFDHTPTSKGTLEFDMHSVYYFVRPINTAIFMLREQRRTNEADALTLHVLPFVERSNVISLPNKIDFFHGACEVLCNHLIWHKVSQSIICLIVPWPKHWGLFFSYLIFSYTLHLQTHMHTHTLTHMNRMTTWKQSRAWQNVWLPLLSPPRAVPEIAFAPAPQPAPSF
jgi:hypothetical protein